MYISHLDKTTFNILIYQSVHNADGTLFDASSTHYPKSYGKGGEQAAFAGQGVHVCHISSTLARARKRSVPDLSFGSTMLDLAQVSNRPRINIENFCYAEIIV